MFLHWRWQDLSDIVIIDWFIVFNAIQQYFSYIVAVSFTGGGNRSTQRKPSTCRQSLTNYHILLYRAHLTMNGVSTLAETSTDCVSGYKSTYHTTTTAPMFIINIYSYYLMQLLLNLKFSSHRDMYMLP